ncbi:unnamed protein product [Pleuronectes platessa]|uniref:Uncharacterized protein n=1 Tax=Pleuronectes platessa TaxID=8262 RepID=A0A9N7V6W0_PLEPL|nr:unnamed protein product [Pleuronectes platessa]
MRPNAWPSPGADGGRKGSVQSRKWGFRGAKLMMTSGLESALPSITTVPIFQGEAARALPFQFKREREGKSPVLVGQWVCGGGKVKAQYCLAVKHYISGAVGFDTPQLHSVKLDSPQALVDHLNSLLLGPVLTAVQVSGNPSQAFPGSQKCGI